MRKLALLSIAAFGLSITAPVFAQGSNSGPQPGLPPGASVGAPNAGQPPSTGTLATTPVPAAPSATAAAPSTTTATTTKHTTKRRVRHMAKKPAASTTSPTPQ